MTYLIIAGVLFCGAILGKAKYDAIYATRNELRKIQKQNERRR